MLRSHHMSQQSPIYIAAILLSDFVLATVKGFTIA